jgi:hypothetical protein
MSFLNTLFLWALPMMSVPVVIHLLNRRQRKVLHWSTMRFLRAAATRRRRLWRLSDLLLLLLRMAAVALIVLALAQPLLRAGWLTGPGPRDVILVFDTTLSTDRTIDGRRVLERQVEEAKRLLGELTDSDRIRVLLADGSPSWLSPVARPADARTRRELGAMLAGLQPSQASADLLRCVSEAVDAEAADALADRVVVLVTDGQAYGWHGETPALWRSLGEKASKETATIGVVRCGAGAPDQANLAVTEVEASRTTAGVGDLLELTATVRNGGTAASAPTLLNWSLGETPLGVSSVAGLGPGEQSRIQIKHQIDTPGLNEIVCRVQRADALAADNENRVIVEATDSLPVLIVSGGGDERSRRNETLYLIAALGWIEEGDNAEGRWRSVFRPDVIGTDELARRALSRYRVVVLADSGPLPAETLARLAEFVRQGGGLWVALGERTKPDAWNQALTREGGELFPLRLIEPVGDPEDTDRFVSIRPPLTPHPATRLLGDTQRLDIDRVHVYRRHRFDTEGLLGEFAILLGADEGEPLAIERALGRGRVIVQTIPPTPDWSNLPISQSWVVLVAEWLWRLAEPKTPRWNLQPGETLEVALEKADPDARVIGPGGRATPLVGVERQGAVAFQTAGARAPGRYELRVIQEGLERTYPFHVQRDPGESSLDGLDEATMVEIAQAGGLTAEGDPLSVVRTASTTPRAEPFWGRLLAALLIVLALETLLAGLLTRRRHDRSPGLSGLMDGAT